MLELALALQMEEPAIIDESSDEEKSLRKAWEKSNRLSIMFM